jgi:hypothetical protein
MADAHVNWKEGEYFVAAGAQATFPYYWDAGDDSKEFFDVGIWPKPDKDHPSRVLRLVEAKREWVYNGRDARYELWLTVKNETTVDITFIANHVRIYSA